MLPIAFETLRSAERTWWYEARKLAVDRLLKHFLVAGAPLQVLDMGAGYGGMLPVLRPWGTVTAYEPHQDAARVCLQKDYHAVLRKDVEWKNANLLFDVIGLFDVLEHIQDDRTFLRTLWESLVPNGVILLTVPAFPCLWSEHDRLHRHYRRYTRSSLEGLMGEMSWTIEYSGYWNTFLFPSFLLARFFGFSGTTAFCLPALIDSCLRYLLRAEAFFLPRVHYPFGSSLILLARKKI